MTIARSRRVVAAAIQGDDAISAPTTARPALLSPLHHPRDPTSPVAAGTTVPPPWPELRLPLSEISPPLPEPIPLDMFTPSPPPPLSYFVLDCVLTERVVELDHIAGCRTLTPRKGDGIT